MSKRQMLETLLETYEYAIKEVNHEQIHIWMNRVAMALQGTGMLEEHQTWINAREDTRYYTSDYGDIDPSLVLHAESMRAILLGILDKVKQNEPDEELFPMELVEDTRNYNEKLALQANGCYQKGWYDACAVMIRRLIEQLIIDCFENHGLSSKIEDNNGDYYGLNNLMNSFLSEKSWHIPRPVKKYLPKLKDLKEIGDSAAHGRNIVTKARIEKISKSIFYTFQGLVEIAYFQLDGELKAS